MHTVKEKDEEKEGVKRGGREEEKEREIVSK